MILVGIKDYPGGGTHDHDATHVDLGGSVFVFMEYVEVDLVILILVI